MNPILLRQQALTPGMLDDLSGQYNQMLNPILEPAEDPSFDAVRQEAFLRNAAMQNNQLPQNPVVTPEALPSMIPEMPANEMFQPQPSLQDQMLGAIAQGINAPEGQSPITDFATNNWMDLLQSGLAGMEENRLAARLPVQQFMEYKRLQQQDEIARQNRLLDSYKLQKEIDFKKQELELQREALSIERQQILSGGGANGSAHMQDAMILQSLNPDADLMDLYTLARTGLPKGLTLNPQTGAVEAFTGLSDTMAGLEAEIVREKTKASETEKLNVEKEFDVSKKIKDANELINLVQEAKTIIPKATAGFAGQAATAGARVFNIPTEAADADAKLSVISAKLVGQVPRFEGPQGVLDVQLYQKAAGDLANTDLTTQERLAAASLMENLAQKYIDKNAISFDLEPNDVQSLIDMYSP